MMPPHRGDEQRIARLKLGDLCMFERIGEARMTSEVRRVKIDHADRAAGWGVVDRTQIEVLELLRRKQGEAAPSSDAAGKIAKGEKGKLKDKPQPDSSLRDTENVPLSEKVENYFKCEVLPHAPDAWIDHDKTKVGYEIPFNRHFYVFEPPRPLAAIDAELKQCTDRILTMIAGLSA